MLTKNEIWTHMVPRGKYPSFYCEGLSLGFNWKGIDLYCNNILIRRFYPGQQILRCYFEDPDIIRYNSYQLREGI